MTRIWFQKHTVEGRLPLLDQWYADHLRRIARPGTVIDIHTLPAEAYPKSIPEGVVRFGAVETFFSHYFARQAYEAERQGYDAFVIGTSQDPGLREGRSLAGIPVLGYGETSFHMAGMTGHDFGIVGFIPELAEPLAENIKASGLQHRFRGFSYIQDGAQFVTKALQGQTGPFLEAFEEAAGRAIASGAQLIIPGEGLPNEILVQEGITSIGDVPILDPDGLLVKMAESLVDLKTLGILSRSAAGYWNRRPDPDYLDHLATVFWK
ncbi:aspartate/glutamate racemase family protein [Ornithinimicrobium faecis]|uniref:Aspartate/glutamate racemase family protein n=1 Tax=Ornithinimicrobium faecis TaxID=2934158 RepID=A0ABY4YUI1_9MICO|nr:aspartate/glutamate racemase family protein [Ornithinimicrobium sp. HY1793]USQ80130.1 aspartate/glutamate racemase family protein [Ornithinimicrobium sp. HY1793]